MAINSNGTLAWLTHNQASGFDYTSNGSLDIKLKNDSISVLMDAFSIIGDRQQYVIDWDGFKRKSARCYYLTFDATNGKVLEAAAAGLIKTGFGPKRNLLYSVFYPANKDFSINGQTFDFDENNNYQYLVLADTTGSLGLKTSKVIDAEFSIYPNPFTNSINLNTDEDFIGSSLSIYNLQGQKMEEIAIRSPQQSLSPNVINGVYFMVLRQNGEIIHTSRLVKN